VVTAAGAHSAVRTLGYVAAFALDEGESISRVAPDAGIAPTQLADALRPSSDGAEFALDPVLGAELLYGHTDPAVAAALLARTRPVSRSLFSARMGRPAWRDRPARYAICSDDRCVAPDLQRVMAARVAEQVEWPTDHSPTASRPDLVAGLVRELAG
jgi:hypothetical protein